MVLLGSWTASGVAKELITADSDRLVINQSDISGGLLTGWRDTSEILRQPAT